MKMMTQVYSFADGDSDIILIIWAETKSGVYFIIFFF